MECPLNYIVVIKSVTVEVGAVDICPTTAEDSSCVLSDYSDEVILMSVIWPSHLL